MRSSTEDSLLAFRGSFIEAISCMWNSRRFKEAINRLLNGRRIFGMEFLHNPTSCSLEGNPRPIVSRTRLSDALRPGISAGAQYKVGDQPKNLSHRIRLTAPSTAQESQAAHAFVQHEIRYRADKNRDSDKELQMRVRGDRVSSKLKQGPIFPSERRLNLAISPVQKRFRRRQTNANP